MGPIWGRQDPGGPHVGPMNFAIWDPFTIGSFFFNVISISRVVHSKSNIFVCIFGSTTNTKSILWLLMAWCFSTRSSVATVLITHPCISSCSWINRWHIRLPDTSTSHLQTLEPSMITSMIILGHQMPMSQFTWTFLQNNSVCKELTSDAQS